MLMDLSFIGCEVCKLVVEGLKDLVEKQSIEEDIVIFMMFICKKFDIEDDKVCDDIIKEYKVSFMKFMYYIQYMSFIKFILYFLIMLLYILLFFMLNFLQMSVINLIIFFLVFCFFIKFFSFFIVNLYILQLIKFRFVNVLYFVLYWEVLNLGFCGVVLGMWGWLLE